MTDRSDVHIRRKLRDREAAAARREVARASGEPMGHGLDALIVDGLALLLAGREPDDPVRVAYQRALSRAFRLREVPASPVVARRLQARLAIGSSLRGALLEDRVSSAG